MEKELEKLSKEDKEVLMQSLKMSINSISSILRQNKAPNIKKELYISKGALEQIERKLKKVKNIYIEGE